MKANYAVKVSGLGVLERLRPSLFVKGAGCIVCHSKIDSNLITTFGYGEAHFLGNTTGGIATPIMGNMPYPIDGGWAPAWQTLSLTGKVIIPRTNLNDTDHQKILESAYPGQTPPSEISLKQLISKEPFEAAAFPDLIGGGAPTLPAVSPTPIPMIAADQLLEASEITIRIPSEEQIAQLAINPPSPGPSGSPSGFSQLTVDGEGDAANRTFTLGKGDIYCNGAMKITTPLVLSGTDHGAEGSNLIKIYTGRSGCWLYATRSVFISGTIKIADRSGGGFLAISSGRAIYWGYSVDRLIDRFFNDKNSKQQLWNLAYSSRAPALEKNKLANRGQIFLDLIADGIHIRRHDDAEANAKRPRVLRPACPEPVDLSGGNNPCGDRERASIENVALLAPEIHFAYGGTFEGVMGADIIAAGGGQLNFSFAERFADPSFKLFPHLIPILGGEVLEVTE